MPPLKSKRNGHKRLNCVILLAFTRDWLVHCRVRYTLFQTSRNQVIMTLDSLLSTAGCPCVPKCFTHAIIWESFRSTYFDDSFYWSTAYWSCATWINRS
ncbi:hypothetical protein BT93_C0837 [Corymbia citriodora subsp. variegata]|nr:hypothetical protein BT93_C0837 [Corymbia citriodora subsp. variegata]